MDTRETITAWKDQLVTHGLPGTRLVAKSLVGAACLVTGVHRRGEFVFDYDWDVLVILDACRYDMYQSVVDSGTSFYSAASSSAEWLDKNFSNRYADELASTAYVTANPHSVDVDRDRFGLLDEVWRYGWDEELETVTAETITDRAITVSRRNEFDRTIIHYMQPHYPFIGGGHQLGALVRTNIGKNPHNKGNIWEQVTIGNLSREDVIEPYVENLRYVMGSVRILFDNIDGKVVVTADHGNALGEYGLWGHPSYIPIQSLRKVPWDVYECVDQCTHEPKSTEDLPNSSQHTVNDRLRSLGYL